MALLDAVGITFLFAPTHHPALQHAAPVRKALGVRTIFNFLGPLANPGRVRRQLVGVPEARRVAEIATALYRSCAWPQTASFARDGCWGGAFRRQVFWWKHCSIGGPRLT